VAEGDEGIEYYSKWLYNVIFVCMNLFTKTLLTSYPKQERNKTMINVSREKVENGGRGNISREEIRFTHLGKCLALCVDKSTSCCDPFSPMLKTL